MTDYGDCTATVRYEVNDIDRLYRCDKPNPHNGAHHDNVAGLTWIEPWVEPSRPESSSLQRDWEAGVALYERWLFGWVDKPFSSIAVSANLNSPPPENVREGDDQ